MLIISLLGIAVFIIINVKKLKIYSRHLFPNAVEVMLFISDAQYYVPVKFCRAAGGIHLFKIMGNLLPKHVKLNKHILWDIIEMDGKEVNRILNGNKIKLPKLVIMPLKDKFKMRRIKERESLLFHIMLKKGMTWFPLLVEDYQEAV